MGGGSGSGGGGSSTTVQKADPWVGVQPYLQQGYGQLANLYQPGRGPQYYPGSTVAPRDYLDVLGQSKITNNDIYMGDLGAQSYRGLTNMNANAASGVAGGLQYANQGANGMATLANRLGSGAGGTVDAMNQLNAAGDPASNPYFQQALNSAIRPVTQQFQEQVMPGIKSGAQGAGQLGGSRQGVAEGIASRGYMDTVGDISSNMGNAAYAQGLQALQASGQLGQGMSNLQGQMSTGLGALGSGMYGTGLTGQGQGIALAPTAIGAQALPGQIIQGLGQQNNAATQQQIDAGVNKWNYNQNLPYTMISDYLSMLNGAQGGMTTANQSGGGGGSKMAGALGGAATGAAVGSMFGPVGTGVGAAGGALYGLFM